LLPGDTWSSNPWVRQNALAFWTPEAPEGRGRNGRVNPTLSARMLFLLHRYLLDENQFFGSESEIRRNVYELFCSRRVDPWGAAQ